MLRSFVWELITQENMLKPIFIKFLSLITTTNNTFALYIRRGVYSGVGIVFCSHQVMSGLSKPLHISAVVG